jgi:hypothetical protein
MGRQIIDSTAVVESIVLPLLESLGCFSSDPVGSIPLLPPDHLLVDPLVVSSVDDRQIEVGLSNYPRTLSSPGFYGGYTPFSDSYLGSIAIQTFSTRGVMLKPNWPLPRRQRLLGWTPMRSDTAWRNSP